MGGFAATRSKPMNLAILGVTAALAVAAGIIAYGQDFGLVVNSELRDYYDPVKPFAMIVFWIAAPVAAGIGFASAAVWLQSRQPQNLFDRDEFR